MDDDKYILVEFEGVLNNVITQTFMNMQRIKLVCFDVSKNFIIFGASSGGIYIFIREPCEFLKLIPSKEGSATKILVSPDEKYVAIASTRGAIIILEDVFSNGDDIDYQIYCEHEGSLITAMRWHANDLFCGDNAGKVSVISQINLLTKAIFQTPSSFLMTLDSSIVQIDVHANHILVSTKTQAYVCNVEKEQYKPVGKKLREGDFGACFRKVQTNETDDVKIFCARPGARLWEATLDGSVQTTYQFKNSLAQPPSELLKIRHDLEENYRAISDSSLKAVPEYFNFGKIFSICNDSFIMSFDANGIYIFDLNLSRLAFWTNYFDKIKDVAFVGSRIYIWQDGWRISTVSLLPLEDLILKILYRKQYYLCGKICVRYLDDVKRLFDKPNKLHLLSILQQQIKDEELLGLIQPVLSILEEKRQESSKKAKNGLVFINNMYADEQFLPESVEDINNEKQASKEIEIVLKQFKLNKTHSVDIPETEKLLTSLSVEEMFGLFKEFIEYCIEKQNEDADLWCREQFVKQCTKRDLDLKDLPSHRLEYLVESYLAVEKTEHLSCVCGYPLPEAHRTNLKYKHLGDKILNTLYSEITLKTVPYLYKYKLKYSEISANLPLLVQYSSLDVFNIFFKNLTYDCWDDILKLTIKLKNGCCLNCDTKIDIKETISWSDLGIVMAKSVGSRNCMKLFQRYSNFIPNGTLDAKFYQSCIFSTFVADENEGNAVASLNFVDGIADDGLKSKFERLLEKEMQRKYLGKCVSDVTNKKSPEDGRKCSACSLPLCVPVLREPARGQCQHAFHSFCFSKNNYICHLCIG